MGLYNERKVKAFNSYGLLPPGTGSEIVPAAALEELLNLMTALHGCVMAKEYETIFQVDVHPMVQTLFPDAVLIFQNDKAPSLVNKFQVGSIKNRLRSNSSHGVPNHQI